MIYWFIIIKTIHHQGIWHWNAYRLQLLTVTAWPLENQNIKSTIKTHAEAQYCTQKSISRQSDQTEISPEFPKYTDILYQILHHPSQHLPLSCNRISRGLHTGDYCKCRIQAHPYKMCTRWARDNTAYLSLGGLSALLIKHVHILLSASSVSGCATGWLPWLTVVLPYILWQVVRLIAGSDTK